MSTTTDPPAWAMERALDIGVPETAIAKALARAHREGWEARGKADIDAVNGSQRGYTADLDDCVAAILAIPYQEPK